MLGVYEVLSGDLSLPYKVSSGDEPRAEAVEPSGAHAGSPR